MKKILQKILSDHVYWNAFTLLYGIGLIFPAGLLWGFSGYLASAPRSSLVLIIIIIISTFFAVVGSACFAYRGHINIVYINKTCDLVVGHFASRRCFINLLDFMNTGLALLEGASPREMFRRGRAKEVYNILNKAIDENKLL